MSFRANRARSSGHESHGGLGRGTSSTTIVLRTSRACKSFDHWPGERGALANADIVFGELQQIAQGDPIDYWLRRVERSVSLTLYRSFPV
jgi:hypothetical protein